MDQETQQTTDTPGDGGASRDDLIAAVREAGGTENVDVAAEEAAAAARAETPAEQPTTDTAPAEEELPIARLLREREKGRAEFEATQNRAQRLLDEARERAARMEEEARERAQRAYEEELARRRAEFNASPGAAVRALGNGDTQAVVDAVLREGTPEWRAHQETQRQLAETQRLAQDGASAKQEIAQLRAELAAQDRAMRIAEANRTFLAEAATPELTPYLHARYTEREILREASALAYDWQEKGLRLGTDFDYAAVAQYLERDARTRITSRLASPPAHPVSAGAPAKEPGNAPKVQANGPRTLSAAHGSERRTSPKPLHEMSPEEARKSLIEEVAAARRANPDATS